MDLSFSLEDLNMLGAGASYSSGSSEEVGSGELNSSESNSFELNCDFELAYEFESNDVMDRYFRKIPSVAISHSNKSLKCFKCSDYNQRTVYYYCNSRMCFDAKNEICKAKYRLYSCESNFYYFNIYIKITNNILFN